MSSTLIISAGLTTLTPLCCRCRRRHCFVVVFAVSVLVVFVAIWHHCRRRCRRRRHRPRSPCRRRPCRPRRHPRYHRTFQAVDVALVVDCCVPSRRRRTIVSLLPWGRFHHGPRRPSSLRHSSCHRSHCPHRCNRLC